MRDLGDRLGIYVDDVYRLVRSDDRLVISTDRAFLVFAAEVAGHFESLVLFGRTTVGVGGVEHELPATTQLVELPYYTDLTHVGEVLRAAPGTVGRMWSGLAEVDVVWIFGPHPFGLLLAGLAALRSKRIVLGVRQDTLNYYRSRLRSALWRPALALTWAIDRAFRVLARRTPTTVVGSELARAYGDRDTVLNMTVTLVRNSELVDVPAEHDWSSQITLLSVGRLEQEKNPLLLVELLESLESARPGRYRLTCVGRGPLAEELASRASQAGLSSRVELIGYVPYGERLLELYRSAHIFVHVSLTEGVPQVLIEAFASGTPVVATDVGGVASTLDEGAAGLLVPPAKVEPLVEAILRLTDDADLRRRVTARALEIAHGLTLEAEAERIARFIADASHR